MTIEEDGKTITLAESGAICEFLIERYGKGKLDVEASGASIQDRADYLYWLHYAEVSTSQSPGGQLLGDGGSSERRLVRLEPHGSLFRQCQARLVETLLK